MQERATDESFRRSNDDAILYPTSIKAQKSKTKKDFVFEILGWCISRKETESNKNKFAKLQKMESEGKRKAVGQKSQHLWLPTPIANSEDLIPRGLKGIFVSYPSTPFPKLRKRIK